MRKISRNRRRAAGIGADLMLSPLVVMMRIPLMAMDAKGGHPWSTETARAVNEKMVATVEGALAAQMTLLQAALRFWPEVLTGRTPSLFNGVAAERSMNAALQPASRTVKANYRRLSAKT